MNYMEITKEVGTHLLAALVGYGGFLFIPSKRRKTEVHIVATWMSFFGFPKTYLSSSTFHKKELERLNNNPGGIDSKGYQLELNREFHKLYFQVKESSKDREFVRIEINKKVSPP